MSGAPPPAGPFSVSMARAAAAIRSSGGRCSGRRWRRRAASPRARSSLTPCPARRAPRAPAVPSPSLGTPGGVSPLAQVNGAWVLVAQPPRSFASPAPCVQSWEAAAASHKNTCLAARAWLLRSAPRPLPVRGDRLAATASASARRLQRREAARAFPSAPSPARTPRLLPACRGGEGRGGRGGLEGGAGALGTRSPSAHAAMRSSAPRTTLCLQVYWRHHPELARERKRWGEGKEENGHRPLGDTEGAGGMEGPSEMGASFLSFGPVPSIPLVPSLFCTLPTVLPRASLRITGTGCSVRTSIALHSWHPQWPGQLREGGAAVEIGEAVRQAWSLKGSSHL